MNRYALVLAIATGLATVSGATQAGGFAPWESARTVAAAGAAAPVEAARVASAATGFAPWRTQGSGATSVAEPVAEPAAVVRVGDTVGTVFRPWS